MTSGMPPDESGQPGRFLWAKWIAVSWWLLLSGSAVFYMPRLVPIFASFGAELPRTTTIWMSRR